MDAKDAEIIELLIAGAIAYQAGHIATLDAHREQARVVLTALQTQGYVTLTSVDIGQLLSVATMYVDSFSENEVMTLPERMRLQEIEAILDRHGRRY